MGLNFRNGMICFILLLALSNKSLVARSNRQFPLNFTIITNQPIYAPGDTVWFKTYLTQGNNDLANGSYRFLINLYSPDGRSLIESTFIINEGSGNGYTALPSELNAGIYSLVFYFDGTFQEPPKAAVKLITVVTPAHAASFHQKTEQNSFFGAKKDISIMLNKTYKKRQLVKLSLKLPDSTRASSAEFSLTVFNSDLFDEYAKNGDFLMAANTYITINCKSTSELERANKIRTALIIDKNSKTPLPDSSQVFVFFQKSHWRYQTFSNTEGKIEFNYPNLKEDDEIFCLVKNKQRISAAEFKWLKPLSTLSIANLHSIPSNTKESFEKFVEQRNLIQEAYTKWDMTINENTIKNSQRFSNIITPPSKVIKFNDYKNFPTMIDYIKEVIPRLSLKKLNGENQLTLKLSGPSTDAAPYGNPICIIDGQVIQDVNQFLSLNTKEIESISLFYEINKLKPFGIFGENGIIAVQSKSGNLISKTDYPIADGIQKKVTYKQGFINNLNNPNFPCFEPILFWKPTITINKNSETTIEFYTSDYAGNFKVVLTGLIGNTFFNNQYSFEVR
jgi:hypothetical protein